jgi:general secretion pathway protein A
MTPRHAPAAGGARLSRDHRYTMYEDYFGFVEQPFSLTPDPKFLYRSETHANAFDLLQYAVRRREGFVVVTGDIGTGKTTLCRAMLEELDARTFTALVLNPFLSEEDLLKLVLQDFGVVSRAEVRHGRLAGASKQDLIDTLNEFLIGLLPLGASAVLVVDEAQHVPPPVLEQIRILSNLETDTEKLLQVVLVGQPTLDTLLRTPEMRQLDQRVSIRYRLRPLTRRETAAYIEHRLAVAGGARAVEFAPRALDLVHRYAGGVPRLINLVCDRALLAAYAERTTRIEASLVARAAASLDLKTPAGRWFERLRRRAAVLTAGAVGTALVLAGGQALDDRADRSPRSAPAIERPRDPAPPLLRWSETDRHRLTDDQPAARSDEAARLTGERP